MLNNLENTLKLVFIDNLDMFFIDEVYARCINGDTLPTGGIWSVLTNVDQLFVNLQEDLLCISFANHKHAIVVQVIELVGEIGREEVVNRRYCGKVLRESSYMVLDFPLDELAIVTFIFVFQAKFININPLVDSSHKAIDHLHQ